MTGFWIIASLLLLCALFILIRGLLKSPAKADEPTDNVDISIFEQRLAELETDLENGLLTEHDVESIRKEIQLSLLNHGKKKEDNAVKQIRISTKNTAIIIGCIVPLLVLSLYFYLGRPDLIGNLQSNSPHHSADLTSAQIEQMVNGLEQRLQEEPDNVDGWLMLYKSNMVLKHYNKAVIAAEKLYKLVGDEPGILLRYADALAMANGNSLAGKATELINRALELDPNNVNGLWLAGMAANERGEYQVAIDYWQRTLPGLKEDPESQQEINNFIHIAQQNLGNTQNGIDNDKPIVVKDNTPVKGSAIQINVSLSAELMNEADANDTLFIYAKAINGPPMPLAVVRKTAKDLPLQVTLDDSMAMMPTNKISDHKQVKITARISSSGGAITQPGDLIGTIESVDTNTQEPVQLVIDQKAP